MTRATSDILKCIGNILKDKYTSNMAAQSTNEVLKACNNVSFYVHGNDH